MSSPDLLYVLRTTVTPALDEVLGSIFELLNVATSCWASADGHERRYDVFFESPEEAAQLEAVLNAQLSEFAGTQQWSIEVTPIKNENWQESWKSYFHVDRVSTRIVIKPTWESYTPLEDDCVIEIDPGMSFGTGQHETTKGCLQFLDTLADTHQQMSFLDLGCGSGILSIAAAKLGYTPIDALDYDPDAVRIANDNIRANQLADKIQAAVADVSNWTAPRTYAVVAANILAPVLIANASRIAAAVTPQNGILILAGILTEQYPEVAASYQALGFTEVKSSTDKEWTSGYFRAPTQA